MKFPPKNYGQGKMDFSPETNHGNGFHGQLWYFTPRFVAIKKCPCNVDSLDIALMVDHFAIFSLYTYRFLPHYSFLSKPLARLILVSKDPLVAHSHLLEEITNASNSFVICAHYEYVVYEA